MTSPYRAAAWAVHASGLGSPLPLHARDKRPAVTGWHGEGAPQASGADVQAWLDDTVSAGNIAVRLAAGVVGVDVDHYGDKRGGDTLARLEAEQGPLPATWRSTARLDDVNGIRLYRVPDGLRWPGKAGPDIDVLHAGNRYAVCSPSVHPATGDTYRWVAPDGTRSDDPPHVDDLPKLPDAWVEALTGGQLADDPHERTGARVGDLAAAARPGDPCRYVVRILGEIVTALAGPNRHDNVLGRVHALVGAAHQGHRGVPGALKAAERAFVGVLHDERRRSGQDAASEWRSMVAGSVDKLGAPPADLPPCGCDAPPDPLAGLIPPDLRHETPQQDAPPAGDAPQQDAPRAGGTPYVDIAALLAAGFPPPPAPTVLRRVDGRALFYDGKANVLFGDPESGKSWIAYAAVAQALGGGQRAAIVDVDHNGAREVVTRLMTLGAPQDALADADRFRYYEPDDKEALMAAVGDLKGWAPGVVVVDSIGEVIPMLGLSSNSPDDYSLAHRAVLSAPAAAGACVIAVDHLPKGEDARKHGQTGTVAKRRAVNGASYRVTCQETFAPGRGGAASLTVSKDRPGGVRAHCPTAKRGEAQPAGRFVMTPRADGRLDWMVTEPRVFTGGGPLAGDIAELDALDPPPRSSRDVQTRLRWGSDRATTALRAWKEYYDRAEDDADDDC